MSAINDARTFVRINIKIKLKEMQLYEVYILESLRNCAILIAAIAASVPLFP